MNYVKKISLDDETSSKLEVLKNKKSAMQNLFISYMKDYFDLYNELKIKDFMDEYTLVCLEYNSIISSTLQKQLEQEEYEEYMCPCSPFCCLFYYYDKSICIIDKAQCPQKVSEAEKC